MKNDSMIAFWTYLETLTDFPGSATKSAGSGYKREYIVFNCRVKIDA